MPLSGCVVTTQQCISNICTRQELNVSCNDHQQFSGCTRKWYEPREGDLTCYQGENPVGEDSSVFGILFPAPCPLKAPEKDLDQFVRWDFL